MIRPISLLLLSASLFTPALADGAPECGLYDYSAVIVRVVDGDTVVADIDLGFRTWRRDEHLRLFGIDAPEVRGEHRENGLASARALEGRILRKTVTVCTIRDKVGSFGRYLAVIYLDGENINDWLVDAGYAVVRDD